MYHMAGEDGWSDDRHVLASVTNVLRHSLFTVHPSASGTINLLMHSLVFPCSDLSPFPSSMSRMPWRRARCAALAFLSPVSLVSTPIRTNKREHMLHWAWWE
jgi:hypothetical protein